VAISPENRESRFAGFTNQNGQLFRKNNCLLTEFPEAWN
jgi:hypothetical protein